MANDLLEAAGFQYAAVLDEELARLKEAADTTTSVEDHERLVMLRSMVQEHERAAGAWQAEWETLSELFTLTGTAVDRLGEVLDGLEVHPGRMRENLGRSSALVMAESVVMTLARRIDRVEADTLVAAAGRRAVASAVSHRRLTFGSPHAV